MLFFILVSSIHASDEIHEKTGEQAKCALITFYNLMKGGVETVDPIKSEQSLARIFVIGRSEFFLTFINIGVINDQVIKRYNTNEKIVYRNSIKQI